VRHSTEDHAIAVRVAERAAEELLRIRSGLRNGQPAAEVRAAGDRGANTLILELLATAAPADPVLSEESPDDTSRLRSRRVWIVDPLDGTREFGEAEREDWAVHVALSVDGTPVVGAVALPATGVVLSTLAPGALPPPVSRPLQVAVSRSRPPRFAETLAERFHADLVPMGSAGAKAAAVLSGRVDAYVHDGGQYEWDSAAPVAVARAAGAHASRMDGAPLTYNGERPEIPDLLICRPELSERLSDFYLAWRRADGGDR